MATIRALPSPTSAPPARPAPSSTASLRRRDGNIAGASEYHWMDGNFLKYDGPLTVADLPVDAHELIALCAPRPCSSAAARQKATAGRRKGSFLAALPPVRFIRCWARRFGNHGVPAHRNRAHLRRFGFPPAHRRPHACAQLAHVYRFCQPLFARAGGSGALANPHFSHAARTCSAGLQTGCSGGSRPPHGRPRCDHCGCARAQVLYSFSTATPSVLYHEYPLRRSRLRSFTSSWWSCRDRQK